MPNVEMRVEDQPANVYLVTREILTKDVFVEIVFLIQSVQIIGPARNINVWTHANCLVVVEQTAM